MGCFDTVMVPCPECGTKNEFQSKGGECRLQVYELNEAPIEVLADVNRHAPVECSKCGTLSKVVTRTLSAAVAVRATLREAP